MSPSRTDEESWSDFDSKQNFPEQNSNLDKMSDESESDLDSKDQNSSESDLELSRISNLELEANFGNQAFFEGVEKLLEVWFSNQSGDISQSDLRKIPR
jgi:hypothetical protein